MRYDMGSSGGPFFMELRTIPSVIGYSACATGKIYSHHKYLPFELKEAIHTQGYKQVTVKTDKGFRTKLVHILVMEAWVGPRPVGMVTNHKNGNKQDNRLENLEYVTQTENMKHSYATGLSPKPPTRYGEALTHLAKLNTEKVLSLRTETDREAGYLERLAIKYGVSSSTVSKVLLRQTWKHI
jgi:hypothetical protein